MNYAIYSMTKKSKKSKKGFTLIELVVVIAILGILAAILVPVIGGFIARANAAKDLANARNLYNCVAMALATGSVLTSKVAGDAMPADVTALFGNLGTGDTCAYVIAGSVVTSATYNAQTYTR